MLNNEYDYCDLEGVDGTLDDHLTKTKAKYNPVLLEFVGEFDLSINKFWYFIFSKFSVQLKKLYRMIKGR
jgi:serine/alanine adding enzyme